MENVFSSMRGGNTVTPSVRFLPRFPRCTNDLLKRVTKNPFNYFTNPKASYCLQLSIKDVLIQFSELVKRPKPGKGCLAPKQIAELRHRASVHEKSVRQNTTKNFSTKDKPGTLQLNVYEPSPPQEKTVDFNVLLRATTKERESYRKGRNILHPQGTYVLYPPSCRPRSLQTSSFYIVKLLEDLADDNHIADVRTEWYSQDLVDPLLFTTTIVSKVGIKRTVNVKWIADDTIEIEESDYIYLALLHSSEDKVLSFEEPELIADNDLNEREDKTDKQYSRPKRCRRMAATANDFL